MHDKNYNGEMKAWHANGQLQYVEIYVDGIPTGTFYTWYDNGKLMFESLYINGERISHIQK